MQLYEIIKLVTKKTLFYVYFIYYMDNVHNKNILLYTCFNHRVFWQTFTKREILNNYKQ